MAGLVGASKKLNNFMNIGRKVLFNQVRWESQHVFKSILTSGIKVVAAKVCGSTMAALCIMFQAGSRMEMDDEIGATHFLRASSGISGFCYTAFMKSRYVYELGGSITCSSDRQNISYMLQCPPAVFDELSPYLIDTAYRCQYYEYDLDAYVRPMVLDDLIRRPPEQHVLDLVQKACFGGGLYNSVYCVKERINTVCEEVLRGFVRKNFRPKCCSIGSVGVPFLRTLKIAENIERGQDSADCVTQRKPPRGYCIPRSHIRAGVETYDYGPGSETWIAVAVPGCGICNIREMLKHAILAAAVGYGNMLDGTHRYLNMGQLPLGATSGDWATQMKAFNINYAETGIFGILVRTKSHCANYKAIIAASFLANIKTVTVEQIIIGKRRLIMDYGRADQSSLKLAEGMALMASYEYEMDDVNEACCLMSSITNEEVQEAACKLSEKCKQMCIAVVGDVAAVGCMGNIRG